MFTASDFFITIFAHIKCLVTINANLFEWKKIVFDSKFRFQDISFKNSPEMHNISMFDYRSQLDISCYRWCCWIHHKRFPCFHKSVAVSTSKTGQTLLKYTLRNFFFISERKWKIENSRNKCHSTWSLPTPIWYKPILQYDLCRTIQWDTQRSLEIQAVDYAHPYPILKNIFYDFNYFPFFSICFSHIFLNK